MPVNKTGWILLVSGIRDYDEPTDAGALGTGKCILNASVLELVYKMASKAIARKGLRDRGPSLAPYRIAQ